MSVSIPLRFMALLWLLLPLAGCGGGGAASLAQWQRDLDRFAANEAHGDMSFLRETTGNELYPRFAALGSKSADDATDAVGVFLGRYSVAGGDWLVFLVGSVKKRDVQDIRIAARSDHDGQERWIMSQPDERMLQIYHSGSEPKAFPSEADVFQVQVTGSTISVREDKTQAHWELFLAERRQPRH